MYEKGQNKGKGLCESSLNLHPLFNYVTFKEKGLPEFTTK